MGLGNHEGGGLKYVNVASGKMHFKENGEKKTADYLEGTIKKIEIIDDEYNGEAIRKVQVTFDDVGTKFLLQFNLQSWYSVGFFSRLGSVDLKAPVKVGVMPSEKNEKVSFCWMRQGENKIEADKERTPRPEKVTVGKGKAAKEVVDYTKFFEFAEGLITLTNAAISDDAPKPAAKDDEGDLPF